MWDLKYWFPEVCYKLECSCTKLHISSQFVLGVSLTSRGMEGIKSTKDPFLVSMQSIFGDKKMENFICRQSMYCCVICDNS
jgi:hypothetical protein